MEHELLCHVNNTFKPEKICFCEWLTKRKKKIKGIKTGSVKLETGSSTYNRKTIQIENELFVN